MTKKKEDEFVCPICDKRYTKKHFFEAHVETCKKKKKQLEIEEEDEEITEDDEEMEEEEEQEETLKPRKSKEIEVPKGIEIKDRDKLWAAIEGQNVLLSNMNEILGEIRDAVKVDNNVRTRYIHMIDRFLNLMDKNPLPAIEHPTAPCNMSESEVEEEELEEETGKVITFENYEEPDPEDIVEIDGRKFQMPSKEEMGIKTAPKPAFAPKKAPGFAKKKPALTTADKVKSEPKKNGNDDKYTHLNASIKASTMKALMLVFDNGECWVPKSTIANDYKDKENVVQSFQIAKWILKKNNIIEGQMNENK